MEQPIAIQCFLAVARLGSFTAAASELYMTRQAVSRQILRLERELGAELFLRTSRRVEITPAGRLFATFYEEQAGEPMDDQQKQLVASLVRQIEGGDAR